MPISIEADPTLAQGYIKVNGTTAATASASGLTATITGNVTGNLTGSLTSGGSLTLETAKATTSGTSIDFTGIPSWVKRITVMLNGVSTSATSALLIQLGAGSPTTSGYTSASGGAVNGGTPSAINSTAGLAMSTTLAAGALLHGHMTILLLGANVWVSSHVVGRSDAAIFICGGGSVTLSNTLDRVRLTTVNGTDTFDAGSVNIMYEG